MNLWQDTTMGTDVEASLSENFTVVEVEHWRVVLDTANNFFTPFSTIVIMFGMGAAISVIQLWTHTKRPIGAVIGMVGQFAVMPAVSFCLALVFKLRPYEALGVLIVSCCPGGNLSNLFTFYVDGDLALSIMMTVCSSLLAFGGMPFNLWLYGNYWQGGEEDNSFVIPTTNIIISLVLITGPVIVGMVVRHFRKRAAEIITRISAVLGWVVVIANVSATLVLNWQVFVMATPLLYVVAAILAPIGFIFAFLLAKLACQNNQIGRTIGIETSSQNMAAALSITLLSFEDGEMKGQLLMFTVLYAVFLFSEAAVGICAYQLYKRLFRKDKNFPAMHTARLESAAGAEK